MAPNPLVRDRHVDFVLHEVLDAGALAPIPRFADHDREVFDLYLDACRRLARDELFGSYRDMDAHPPELRDGRVRLHPEIGPLYGRLVELGLLTATRPAEVGGAELPAAVANLGSLYLMAANLHVVGFAGLTSGAAHLIEAFGDEALRERFMAPMYAGRWTGTMALTEPQAGSSLADITSTARPTGPGQPYRLRGAKIFISGGDQDFAENVLHMTLARIEGAPSGLAGVSLFAVPRERPGPTGALEDNDVAVTQSLHKLGWRGIPSLALNFGERDDCHAWLVGEAGHGLRYMFQMMNEARLMVGANGIATASAAYQAAAAYALERTQGRPVGEKDPSRPPVPIFEHAEVRRLLLRQKCIVEAGVCMLTRAGIYADLAAHHPEAPTRERAGLLLDLLTPVVKSFPAEYGFESCTHALQVFGGYGYTTDYLPEAWLRDQKLNTIHEGTTQIQGLDLLGRKVMARGGAAMRALLEEVDVDLARARAAGVPATLTDPVARAGAEIAALTAELGALGLAGDLRGMLRPSGPYLDLVSLYIAAWQWVAMAAAASEGLARPGGVGEGDAAFYRGQLRAAQAWIDEAAVQMTARLATCRATAPAHEGLAADEL